MAEKEYIEREALIAEYDRVHIGEAGGARKLMVEAPAADVVEVVHGYWILSYTNPYGDPNIKNRTQKICSCCGWTNACRYAFCPNCGAKMDGKGG